MNIAEKLSVIAENEQQVYNAGKLKIEAEFDEACECVCNKYGISLDVIDNNE